MIDIRVCRDLGEIHRLWHRHWPQECFFDLWPVRACFQRHFKREPYALVAERQGAFAGMVALSWIDEETAFGHFPGEVWHGKTWQEQNRFLAADSSAFKALWEAVPAGAEIRYLRPDGNPMVDAGAEVDELNYMFSPAQYGYDFNAYMARFSGKTRKKFRAEIERLNARGVEFRYDRLADVDRLLRMNMDAFGANSYFSDRRFLNAFEDMVVWLHHHDLLRVTTVLVGGEMAAVDVGAVWNNTYTLVAGGTCADFPGVAKLINFHHMEWACRQKMQEVDFLCGEFNWKDRFLLTPRPLYRLTKQVALAEPPLPMPAQDLIHAAG
jgi:hypothetical protein